MRFLSDVGGYGSFLNRYSGIRLRRLFSRFETRKDGLVDRLTKERGRWVRPFIHSGVIGLVFIGVTLGPAILDETVRARGDDAVGGSGLILGLSTFSLAETVATQISDKPRAEIIQYEIQSGDTVSTIAKKFDVSDDTIYWENNITPKTVLKPGDKLRILPVSGIRHSVTRGETVESIAKKYDVSAQAIVDWPFNTFVNDENFALAVGQSLVVPDGVKPDEVPVAPRQYLARQTPDAGTIVASGQWVWPVAGRITQFFVWYHPALDIANKEGPAVVAADSGKVIAVISQRYGYGNHIIIDHGNGFQTLYAHLSSFGVTEGQSVGKGSTIGAMGSTGRSTGTHLHFEIRKDGAAVNPLNFLK